MLLTGREALDMAVSDGLEVTWYGHAMFTVTGGGVTVATDPVPPEVGYRYDPVPADVVLVSHSHFDHGHIAGIVGNPEVIRTSGNFAVAGLSVTGIDSFHDSKGGSERGPNVIYVWEQGGMRLAHLGDLGEVPGRDVLDRLGRLDVAMIPVGGVFTIDGDQAARLAAELAPSIVLPIHYKTQECSVPLDTIDNFTSSFDGPVREVAERPLHVDRDSLPAQTEVWVVPYQ
jgi:L-ascorbate metabolism protein UlaG (beta-lactamase superfamily)